MPSETGIHEDPPDALAETLGADLDDELEATLHVENIGGITECTVPFTPGITILTGENATNRTSFLTALNGVLGGSEATLRTDADSGRVELEFEDGTSFHRTYDRERGTVATGGEPFTDDADLVDTFVTLLELNDARQAVERGENLRDVLMRPVDTDAIQREIREQSRERDELQDRLDEIDQQLEREAALTERKQSLQDELESIEAQIEEKQGVVEEYEADMDMAEEAEALVDEVESARQRARELENEIEVLNAELDALQDEETELEADLLDLFKDAIDDADMDVPDDAEDLSNEDWDAVHDSETESSIKNTVTELQTRKDELSTTIDDLTRIINFNETVVDDASELPGVSTDDDTVTAALDPESQEVECWTCGSTVERDAITSRTAELQDLVEEKRDRLSEINDELEAARDRLTALQESQKKQKRIKARLKDVREEQASVEETIEETEADLESTREKIDELQEDVQATAELRESDLLDAYQELNELEYERGQVVGKIDDVEAELDDIEDAREDQEYVESKLEEVREDLDGLRSRVADLEREAVDEFNTRMEDILDKLRYKNIERVWIERKVQESSTGMDTGEFELHIVRESEDGSVFEDTVSNLSESEGEVIGLIVALAGYLVHDVSNKVPFIILDSVEAVDSNRLVDLIEYFAEHSVFLTVALLPGDAAAFSESYDRVTADMLA